MKNSLFLILSCAALLGCTAADHRADLDKAETIGNDRDQLTVGSVQRYLTIGMSSADVLDALGSPNIVSTDAGRREVWVYDRVASERVYSDSSGGLLGGVGGGSGDAGAGVGGLVRKSAGASSRSQRTLTVVVRFDDDQLVRDFSYRTSRF
jgi:outer membrane protein assembly factor BamE (lipoprotein component of BamABCDE complex)